jgi:hypothetical protein
MATAIDSHDALASQIAWRVVQGRNLRDDS